MIKCQLYVFLVGFRDKILAQLLYESCHLSLLEKEVHLPFIYFSDVHELVHQPKNTLGIAEYCFVKGFLLLVGIHGHELLKRTCDKGHWSPDFVRNIDEKLEFGFVYLFGMNVLLDFLANFVTMSQLVDDVCSYTAKQQKIQ